MFPPKSDNHPSNFLVNSEPPQNPNNLAVSDPSISTPVPDIAINQNPLQGTTPQPTLITPQPSIDNPPPPWKSHAPLQTTEPPASLPPIRSEAAPAFQPPTTSETFQPVITTTTIPPINEPKPKSKKKLVIGILILFFFTLIFSTLGLAYAVAYEKIKISNTKVQLAVANAIISLPGTPKTPKFLVAKTVLNQKSVGSTSFDLSLAVKTSQKTDLFNGDELDLQMKGVTNYKDDKDVDASFNTSWGKDLNFDFIKYSNMIYFKINTIPANALNLIGINPTALNPLLSQWVSYDTSKLETEASKVLEEKEVREKEVTQESLIESFNEVFDEKIVQNIKITNGEVDGASVYKLTLDADDNMVNHIIDKIEKSNNASKELELQNDYTNNEKPSDTIKNLKIEMNLDKRDYFMKKFVLAFDIMPNQKLSAIPNSNVLGAESSSLSFLENKISIAMVGKFDKFGSNLKITPPSNPMTFDEFTVKFREVLMSLYPNYPLVPLTPDALPSN